MKGILGKKIGMTQVFTTQGEVIPVTVIKVDKNVVLQLKTKEVDGYEAVKLAFEDKAQRLVSKAQRVIYEKLSIHPKRWVKEIRNFELNVNPGQDIYAENLFKEGDIVNVTSISKGKGFQGVIKRHNQSRGPMSHGSRYHRRPGSMGAIAPNRVFKGKKLPGHMGNKKVTIQNLELVKIDKENKIILIKGSVPGSKKSLVVIRNNTKNRISKKPQDLINFTKNKS